jgi:hypothetical protein
MIKYSLIHFFSITLGFACFLLIVLEVVPVSAVTYYISTDGNDKWSGKISNPNKLMSDGPFASLEHARNEVRKLKLHNNIGPIHILISKGNYTLSRTFVLTAQDSGTKESPIFYEAAPYSHPIFSWGKVIKGLKPGGNGFWIASIPEVDKQKWYFEQLWINNHRATRARTPNGAFNLITAQVKENIKHPNSKFKNLAINAFIAKPQDIEPLRSLTEKQMSDVTVNVYHSWETSRLPLCCVNFSKNIVFLNGDAHWPFMSWGLSQRYFLENFKTALDEPGEWFLERNGMLYYKPLPNENIQTTKIIAPTTEQFIRFEGTPGKNIEFITIKGLSFRHGQYIQPAQGISNGQAADGVQAVILADNARNINLLDNEIAHTGLYGMWFRRGCSQIKIVGNYLHDLGAGGIRIGEGVILPEKLEQTHHVTINNNLIRNGGHLFPGAVGIWVGQSSDNQITHNEISNFNYTGISVGWTWGYGESLAKRNAINFNKIHHIGQYILSDLGGIYTLGVSNGTTIKNNLIHDIYSFDKYGRGGWGIYNDLGSSNILIENNLVYKVKKGGYHLNGGKNNIVKNNIFALSQDGQLQRSVVEDHLSISFINNIVYWKNSDLFRGSWGDIGVHLDQNIFWDASRHPSLNFTKDTLKAWNSFISDPMFINPEKGNFRLRSNSVISKINFKPFDYRKAGINQKLKWAKN